MQVNVNLSTMVVILAAPSVLDSGGDSHHSLVLAGIDCEPIKAIAE
jgi:hypothetical protein